MIRPLMTCTLAFVLLSIRFGMAAEPAPSSHVSYLIVSSRAAQDDPGWKQVAEALLKKHGPDSKIVVYDKQVGEVLAALRQAAPRHVCFVTPPTDAGRQFVADVHRLMRKIDDDPYTDALWGILTGYDAAGAYVFEITPLAGEKSFAPVNTNGSQRGGRPLVQFFDGRLKDFKVLEGAHLLPVLTDSFLLVPNPKQCDVNKKYRVVFTAGPA